MVALCSYSPLLLLCSAYDLVYMHCWASEQAQWGFPQRHLSEEQGMSLAVWLRRGSNAASWWLGPQALPHVAQGT